MKPTGRLRQIHRWTSIAFAHGAIANMIAIFGLGMTQPPALLGLAAFLPLVVLLLTGLYMFFRPYFVRTPSTGR